jgi:hypothetical protein
MRVSDEWAKYMARLDRESGGFYAWSKSIKGGGMMPLLVDGSEQESLEWIMRHGTPERVMLARLQAAEIIEAYRCLVSCSEARRKRFIAALVRLRRSRKLRDEAIR